MAEGLVQGMRDAKIAESDAITFEYNADGKVWSPRINTIAVVHCLVMDPNNDVTLIGEGDFTFSVALAALRGSWKGITTTVYGDNNIDVRHAKLKSVEYCLRNNRMDDDDDNGKDDDGDTGVLEKINRIIAVENEPAIMDHVDDTDTPEALKVRSTEKDHHVIVWFQCPWVARCDGPNKTYELITKFLSHMSDRQKSGDYIFIGITKHSRYVDNYGLHKLFIIEEENFIRLRNDVCSGYTFLGGDVTFIKEILAHGYHHEGLKDIHDYIYKYHITLVFLKD